MKKILLSLCAFVCLTLTLAAEERVVVNTGHTAPILDLAFLRAENSLFTTGEDGTVRKWDIRSKRLRKKLQISHLPVVRITVHPEEPLIALVETDRINTYHLSVWNYSTEEELYSHKISEVPLFLRFSPKGTYLVYGLTDWESLTFLESETGYEERLFNEGFGIVSAAFISDTEKTLLTYSPSGEVRYWDLPTGRQKASGNRINTEGSLQDLSFVPGGRYLVGRKGSTVYMTDLVTGRVVDSREFGNIRDIAMSADGESIAVLDASSYTPEISVLSLSTSGRSSAGFSIGRSFLSSQSAQAPIAWDGRRVYFSSNGGSLYSKLPEATDEVLFAGPVLLNIHDLAFSKDMLFISSDKHFLSIRSEAFEAMDEDERASSFDFTSRLYSTPISGRTGLISFNRDGCLIFPREEQGQSPKIYRFTDESFSPFYEGIESPIETGTRFDENLLILEKNGTIKIIDAQTGENRFSYSSFGLRSISEVYNGNLIAARNRTDFIDTPLLHINPDTGETVPIDDSNILTFYLEYDEMTRKLYTLGYEERAGGLRTVLKQHSGFNYDRVTTLISYPGEDPEASLAVDSDSSRIFTSLGFGKVHMYAWNGFTYLESINHIPRSLYVHSGHLYSLNGDSSISVWDTERGDLLMTIYIFEDFSWAVVPTEGRPYTHGGAEKYLHRVR